MPRTYSAEQRAAVLADIALGVRTQQQVAVAHGVPIDTIADWIDAAPEAIAHTRAALTPQIIAAANRAIGGIDALTAEIVRRHPSMGDQPLATSLRTLATLVPALIGQPVTATTAVVNIDARTVNLADVPLDRLRLIAAGGLPDATDDGSAPPVGGAIDPGPLPPRGEPASVDDEK